MPEQKTTFRQVIKAVFGAMIGVQSEQQRQQDFSASGPLPYIVVGILFTLLFVATLLALASWALA